MTSTNEQIELMFDEFTNPYNQDKIEILIERLQKAECEDGDVFEFNHIEDFTTYLISKKGFHTLCYTYTQLDVDTIEKIILEIENESN